MFQMILLSTVFTYVCASGSLKCSFFGKFGLLCFLETTVLRFALLPYYGQILNAGAGTNIYIF